MHHQVNGIVGSVLTQPVMVTNGWTSGIVPSFLRLITIIIIMNDQPLYQGAPRVSCMLSIFAEMDRDNPLESFMLLSRVWVDQRFI